MRFTDLLSLRLSTNLSVNNEPFTLVGKLTLDLEGGEPNYYLLSEMGTILSVHPRSEEMVLFRQAESQIERDDDIVVEGGKDYEFSYEDRGVISETQGEVFFEEGDELSFIDYEADDGARIRAITNEYSGDEKFYVGSVVTEEDILLAD